jgi:hypothetical protein
MRTDPRGVSKTPPPAMLIVRRAFVSLLLLASSACLPHGPDHPATVAQPELRPEAFFAGRTRGEGTLTQRFRAARTVHVVGTGMTEPDGSFRLDQAVTFDDGTIEARTWRVRRTSAHEYSATLSDADGEVKAESSGNSFHLRYLLRRPAVYMDQWLYLQTDGRSVLNRATVTVLGVPWARLTETIERVE